MPDDIKKPVKKTAKKPTKKASSKSTKKKSNTSKAKTGTSKVAQKKTDKLDEINKKAKKIEQKTGKTVDELYQIGIWYNRLKESTNDRFFPLYRDKHRYLVLCGGGGSGKSIFAGRKLLERVTSEQGHRFLVCRKVARTIRESCFEQLLSQLSTHYPDVAKDVNRTDMRIRFSNGNEILFAGLDDVEKLKSIHGITGIWIEEASEITEQDFNQLDIRLRGDTANYKQIVITFNPVSVLHWLKLRFFDNPTEDVITHRSTYLDNKFLDDEAKKVLESFKGKDEYYYTVYCLGEWGVTGKTVFNAVDVTRRLSERVKPVKQGYFELRNSTALFHEDNVNPIVRIYTDVVQGVPYVIGGDTAGEGSDSFIGQVIDNRTGQQVAILKHTFDEDVYAKQMYCLGMYYNKALIAIETNYSTYPVMELERLNYPKQYVRESVDDYTHKPKSSYGFQTTAKTRPVIISGLISALREDINLVCDNNTLEEMLTFVRNENFRAEAEDGAHDDCIIALAIAHHARTQQRYYITAQEAETVEWHKDMWEDYYNANAEGKAYLIQKWGKPKR